MERVLLLVEDDAVDAESILRALSAEGSPPRVVWKTTAEEAFAWLEARGTVEVIGLVDVNLPGMNGFEFVQRWKDKEPAVVWFLSSSMDQDEIDRAEADPAYKMKLKFIAAAKGEEKRRGPRYTPLSKRQDRPNAILWLVKFHLLRAFMGAVRLPTPAA